MNYKYTESYIAKCQEEAKAKLNGFLRMTEENSVFLEGNSENLTPEQSLAGLDDLRSLLTDPADLVKHDEFTAWLRDSYNSNV